MLGIRAATTDIAAIDARAADEKAAGDNAANRSELARRLIAYGLQHMPKGWKP